MMRPTLMAPVLAIPLLLLPAPGSRADGSTPEGQTPAPKPCTAPEFSQFDFWVGEWDLSWKGGTGSNVITRELGECVIRENFSSKGLRGISVSTYVPELGQWRQTWVDSNGSYLEFVGGMDGDRLILTRECPENDSFTHQRMIFLDIQENSITWDWEGSPDDGETWKVLWQISYERRATS